MILKTIVVASLTLGAVTVAHAGLKSDARQVFENQKSSVLSVKGLMKVEVSMNGQIVKTQDAPISTQGVVVAKDLVLVSYRTVMPEVGVNTGKQPGLSIDTNLQELKLVDGSGEEFDAKLVLHDEALDLAFLALDPSGDNTKKFSYPAVDLTSDINLQSLDDVVCVKRFGEGLRYVAGVSLKQVTAVIEKPRKAFICSGVGTGTPVFTPKGEFVGLTVVKKSPVGKQASPVVLPAKYAQKLLGQAKQKSVELIKEI